MIFKLFRFPSLIDILINYQAYKNNSSVLIFYPSWLIETLVHLKKYLRNPIFYLLEISECGMYLWHSLLAYN